MLSRRPITVYAWQWRTPTERVREIVAARSRAHVARITGWHPGRAVDLMLNETDDVTERDIALARPGVIFTARDGGPFEPRH